MKTLLLNRKFTRSAMIAAALAACANAAWADNDERSDEVHGIIGLGVASIPKYVGGKTTKSELFPVAKITRGRFFAGGGAGLGVGYEAYEAGDFTFGATLSHELSNPRKESDDPHLKGLGDVKATSRAGLYAHYSHEWLRASVSVSTDVGGKHQGVLSKLSAEAVYHPAPAWELSAGPSLVYGSSQYQKALFGVDAGQSLRSGLPVYTPKSGLTQIGLEFGGTYAVSKTWLVGAKLVAGRLEGDAGKSPIVEKKSQSTAGVFAAYRF